MNGWIGLSFGKGPDDLTVEENAAYGLAGQQTPPVEYHIRYLSIGHRFPVLHLDVQNVVLFRGSVFGDFYTANCN